MKYAVLSLILLSTAAPVGAQAPDPLRNVRALYDAASYEEALAGLSALEPTLPTARVEQFRAFCLIALGRIEEASAAVVRAVEADPTLEPSPNDASPRVRAFFADARRKILPDVVKRNYAAAKASFTANDFAAAKTGFASVVSLSESLGPAPKAELADLTLLAREFHALSEHRLATSAPPVAAPVTPAPVVETRPAVAINQVLPPWNSSGSSPIPLKGELKITIDDKGVVTSAVIIKPTGFRYDQEVVDAALRWRYHPATRNGKPLESEKIITYVLSRATK